MRMFFRFLGRFYDLDFLRSKEKRSGEQVCPFDMVERELWLPQLEFERADLDIECAVEITVEVESA